MKELLNWRYDKNEVLLLHRLLLSFYCHLVYSLLSRQTHQYILIKSMTIKQWYTPFALVTNRWCRSTRNYTTILSDRTFTFNIHVLHNDLSISTETCIMDKRKLNFALLLSSLQALSTKNLHRLLLYVEDRVTASSILF